MTAKWNERLTAVQTDDRRTVYRLRGGAVFAIDHVPHYPEIGGHAQAIANVLKTVGDLDAATREVENDVTLSKVGRDRRLAPLREAAKAGLARGMTEVAEFYATAYAAEERALKPPALAPGDLVGAIRDWELRSALTAAKGPDRAKLIGELANNEHLLAAVIRAPIPIPTFSEMAPQMWREFALKNHPEGQAAAKLVEAAEWAHATLTQILRATDHEYAEPQTPEQIAAAATAARAGPPAPVAIETVAEAA